MTRREIALLITGVGFGALLGSLAVPLEFLLSVPNNSSSGIAAIGVNGITLLIPAMMVVAGLILLAFQKRPEHPSS